MAKLKIFVACPYMLFPFDDYKAVFTKISRSYDVEFIFANELITNKHILAKIEGYIESANFSLFDITGWNPNVTLKLGIAVGRRKKHFLLLNHKIEAHKDVTSDIKGIDRIEYNSNMELHSKIIILINQEMPAEAGPKNISFKSLETKIMKSLKTSPGLNIGKLTEAISVEKNLVQSMVRTMVASGKLKTRGQRKGANYFSADTDMRTIPRKSTASKNKQTNPVTCRPIFLNGDHQNCRLSPKFSLSITPKKQRLFTVKISEQASFDVKLVVAEMQCPK